MATIPASDNEFPKVLLAEGAAAATPGTGLVVVYAKSDGKVYSKDDAGTETELAAATAALAAHLADTSDAHDASAISILDTLGSFTATDVEAALAELYAAIGAGGIPATIVDAKGDLIAATAADTVARRAVGTDGQYLKADSGQATGLNWETPLAAHTHAASGIGATGGGASLAPTSLIVDGIMRWDENIDSTVNADQNDFNPTGLHTSMSIRFTSFSANRTLTGLDAGSNGEIKVLVNNTSFSMLLTNESASSSAANRFRCPNASTVTVRTSGAVIVMYIAGRWTVIGSAA